MNTFGRFWIFLGFAFFSSTAAASLVQNWPIEFGVVPIQKRQTIALTFGSNINAISQHVGHVSINGSPDFTIENDGCSGASIPRGAICYFDAVFSPTTKGFQMAQFSYTWTGTYRDPETQETSAIDGVVYYNLSGRTCAYSLFMELSKNIVSPDNLAGIKLAPGTRLNSPQSQTTVSIQIQEGDGTAPQCLSEQWVEFKSEEVVNSGGHNHGPERPLGEFNNKVCLTNVDGRCSVVFTASEFGGFEKIIASLEIEPAIRVTYDLPVMVPNLVDADVLAIPFIGTDLRLTGSTDSHVKNHFVTPLTALNALGLAKDFVIKYNATLGLNDMSLEHGGFFDIGPSVNKPLRNFWAKPHWYHRKGTSVDVDHCALSIVANNPNPASEEWACPAGYVTVPSREFRRMCSENNGVQIPEQGGLHCEF